MNPIARTGPLAVTALFASALWVASASAATITPTITADEFDNGGGASDTGCSLREAVLVANTDSTVGEDGCVVDTAGGANPLGDDTISFGASPYSLTIGGDEEDVNGMGDLDVDTAAGDLTLDGAGATATTITQTTGDRVLQQVNGSTGTLTISDLTLGGGNSTDGIGGGGIYSGAGALVVEEARVTGNAASEAGGGISAGGSNVEVTESVVSDNATASPSGGGGIFINASTTINTSVVSGNEVTNSTAPSGGGIANAGETLTVTDSAITGNEVIDTDNADVPKGAGIGQFNGTTTIRRTTISGNELTGGGAQFGAGVNVNGGAASLLMVNSTVSGNEALGTSGSGGGLSVDGGAVTIVHTTFGPNPIATPSGAALRLNGGSAVVRGSVLDAASGPTACHGLAPTSLGGNVEDGSGCGFVGPDDVQDDPELGALADNGNVEAGAPGAQQPVRTHLPALASPAIDLVPVADCDDAPAPIALDEDQRGQFRPDDGDADAVAACDSGSVELQTPPPAPALSSISPGLSADDNTPLIQGTAETNSTVSLYANAACTGTPAATGTAAQLASPGIQASVPDSSTTTFRATATSVDGTSPCSSGIAYQELAPPSATPPVQQPPAKKCKKGQKLKKGKCVKKKRKKK